MSDSLGLTAPSWSPTRKVAAAAFAVAAVAGLTIVTGQIAGSLFLALNRVDPREAAPADIINLWQQYTPVPEQRRRLTIATGTAAFCCWVILPGLLVAATRRSRPLHGAARFANRAEIRRAGLLLGHQAEAPSILVGRYRGHYLALPGQLSVMLSAPTRSGKGVGVVIPNLLQWPDSVVVLDIKGENHHVTAGFRATHGQAVYAFSPFDDEGRSHRWNPLTPVRADPLHRVGDLLAVGQILFPNDTGGTSSEAFFNDQARNLFLGLGLLLLETPELTRSIGEMLRQASGKGQTLKDHLTATIAHRRESGRPFTDECVDALQRLLSNSDNTLSSIVATFNAPLTVFADTVVDAATSGDDFYLEDVRRRRMSVYVRVPPNRLASARPLLNLFFSQLVSLNTRHLPEQDPTLRHQCLLINDEFTAMGRVSVITHAAAFLAGYNLRLLTVVQAMSQLDAVYGDKEARTFATNHGLQILYAPREQRDADEYSAMLGHFTERAASHGRSRSLGKGHTTVSRNESEQRRALLLPQEFKELGTERLVLILENCKPVLAEKLRYHRDPVLKQRLLEPPAVPRMDLDLHMARIQQRWRSLPDELDPDDQIRIDRLAHDMANLPERLDGEPSEVAATLLRFFSDEAASGGALQPLADEDGVLLETVAVSADVAHLADQAHARST